MVSLKEAEKAYHEWVAAHLCGQTPNIKPKRRKKLDLQSLGDKSKEQGIPADILPGSLMHITSGLLRYEKSRVRKSGEGRRQGSISRAVYDQRNLYAHEIFDFINLRHGQGAIGWMMLADLSLDDVEAYSSSQVTKSLSQNCCRSLQRPENFELPNGFGTCSKRLQFIKAIIDRAERPEHNGQVLGWNWNSRDVRHGKPAKKRKLPTLKQLQLILGECGPCETAMVWTAIGCGFGQRDLAAIRVGQFDKKGYDLRRGKTGVERYGETPPLVWKVMQDYLKQAKRTKGDFLFITVKGMPIVHDRADSVTQWWTKLLKRLGKPCKGISGFYTLRHLGATEFSSRPGCSIGEVKRWLGHSASSDMADVYIKPVSPENRQVVEWVRNALCSGKADLPVKGKSI